MPVPLNHFIVVERSTQYLKVEGSNPGTGDNFFLEIIKSKKEACSYSSAHFTILIFFIFQANLVESNPQGTML